MKLSEHPKSKLILLITCCVTFFLAVGVNQLAQTQPQLPARSGYVNDFAGVVDAQTKLKLENILANVHKKMGIEFAVATVESTSGQDIFDYSRQLSTKWKVGGRTSAKKSLLLVLAVNEKESFTQFSRSVQNELPEGVLGELSQRMRALVTAGQFSEGVNAGVHYFVSSMAEKLSLNPEEFDNPTIIVAVKPPPTETVPANPPSEPTPITITTPVAERPRTIAKAPSPREETPRVRSNTPNTPEDDADESEEVELTLTLPLAARVAKLKQFLEEYPDSKSKPRAIEILVSAHAGLGDERLKKGDSAGGVRELMLAIAEAPVNTSEKLFSGVIAQIPLNLYLRGEREAAAKAAQTIEAKFGGDPKRLLAISGFYIGTEQGAEAVRVATQAVTLAPDSAEAHKALALALHISLRLDEAAAEYGRALQLDPNSKGTRRSLADLRRASGKAEEALALYRQQLAAEPNDKAARAGLVLSLLELKRVDEAKAELESALKSDPKNLALLGGAAYWFAAHDDPDKALELGTRAINLEPRYTWSQVAVARALIAQKKPLEAERAIRFARQFAKFPTLDYELANALVAAGLYAEAAEVLMQTFAIKDNQVETRLGGRNAARDESFVGLLAPERRASIFQFAAAESENNARVLKALLALTDSLDQEEGKINEERAVAAARGFAAGDDDARVHRQLYAASRLLQKGVGFQAAYELTEAARSSAEAGMNVPALTVVVQADEYREMRARAISAGATPGVAAAPRDVLSNLLRGRIEDLAGWSLFKQDRLDEAVERLKRAVGILPEGTPSFRTALWHLGATLERQGKKEEALANYIRSYNVGEPDQVRRSVIERLYRAQHGSLAGLEEQLGPAAALAAASKSTPNAASAQPESPAPQPSQPTPSPDPAPSETPTEPLPAVEPTPTRELETATPPTEQPLPDAVASPTPEAAPQQTPEATVPAETPSPTPTPLPEAPPSSAPTEPSALSNPIEKMDTPRPTVVTIKGRVLDVQNKPIANAVVVLISAQGSVLASTTDAEGNFSFAVAPSTNSYRLIPSRDGFTFQPVDRVLAGINEDQKDLDFVGRTNPSP
ncbi:MAG TPA: TPM domain-containing protein [Pyrinomonadaceae bacterium]|nr:TPM domain-containing protein [Pyrinomonadaceae bacterium]